MLQAINYASPKFNEKKLDQSIRTDANQEKYIFKNNYVNYRFQEKRDEI